MDPIAHSSSPREERESGTPGGAPAAQFDPSQPASHDNSLSALVSPGPAQVKDIPIRELFDKAMERMYAGELYRTFQERIKELQVPLPSDHGGKIEEAVAAFHHFPVEKKVEVLNEMLSQQRLNNRVAWPIPTAPMFHLPRPEKRTEAAAEMENVATELLRNGTLPSQFIYHSVMSLESQMRATHSRLRGDALFGSAAAALCGVVGVLAPWWVTVPVLASSCVMYRLFTARPDYRSEYVKGHLAEAAEAVAQVHVGGVIPMMMGMLNLSTALKTPAGLESSAQKDAFLLSRALRVLGRPPQEISHYFAHQSSVDRPGNVLAPAITEALAEHGISLGDPLLSVLTQPGSQENRKVLDFLELMNAAHFTWAGRDRDKLRAEFADIILQVRGEIAQGLGQTRQ
jgi:hypothetical protein